MAYNPNKLFISRGSYNQSVSADNKFIHTYVSDDDLHSTITTSGYFPDYFGVRTDDVKTDDLIFIKDSTNNYLSYRITNLSPVTLVPENISDNPFDQSLNTTNSVTFVSTDYTPQASNPGGTETVWINSFDGHLYRGAVDIENATGDVTGPVSATDNAFARFDLATGKVIQNSAATLDDSGVPTFVDRVNIDTNVFWDNETITPGNVIFSFDANDYFIYDKTANSLAFLGGAVTNFKAIAGGDFQIENGLDTLTSKALNIGPSNATQIDFGARLNLSVVANDDTQTQFLVWNSGTNDIEYRNFSSFDLVNGPPSPVTDNAIVRWDGTSGAQVQNTNVLIDDSDNLTIPAASQLNTDTIGETTAAAGVTIDGVLLKDSDITAANINGTLFTDTSLAGGGTTLAEINNNGEITRGSLTQEIYFPAYDGVVVSTYKVTQIGGNGTGNFNFSVPDNADTIVSIELIGWPSAAAAGAGKDIDLESNYGGIGESISQHNEVDATSTYDLGTTDTKFSLDISSVFSSLAAGDTCGLLVTQNGVGGNVNYTYIKLTYTIT